MLAQVVMLLWSYFAALLSEPGKIPPGWSPFASDEVRQPSLHASLVMCAPDGACSSPPMAIAIVLPAFKIMAHSVRPSEPQTTQSFVKEAVKEAFCHVFRRLSWRQRGQRRGGQSKARAWRAAGGPDTAGSVM